MRTPEPISGITGISPGGEALIPLKVNCRVHNVQTKIGAVIGGDYKGALSPAELATVVEMFTIEVGGHTVRQCTPAELIKLNAEDGNAYEPGRPVFYFTEPQRATVSGEEAFAWPLYGVPENNALLKVKFKDTAVGPTLTALQVSDTLPQVNGAGQPFANIVHWLRRSITNTGAGEFDENTLEVGGLIHRITFDSDKITKLVAKIGTRTIWDADRNDAAELYKPYKTYQQAGSYLYAPEHTNIADDALNTGGQQLQLRLTSTGAGNFYAITRLRKTTFR
ncbi:hypothetical protein OpiT1DRAFT_04745 [Opitutaceae bacterium TAV1]|nr:hypothetical protein OpiT1DRAFT_04745 [Opitutaceae bacterium TAV1]